MENEVKAAAAAAAEEAKAESAAGAVKTAAEAGSAVPAEAEKAAAAAVENTAAAETELSEDEKRLIRNYALNDAEVRRIIVSDYIARLKTENPAPAVMQGDAGSSPAFVPKAARDMREAAILAEALLKRR